MRAVLRLHPRLIVYDIQITGADDGGAGSRALLGDLGGATGGDGHERGRSRGTTQIFGGNANVRRAGALPAYDGVPDNSDELVDRLDAGFHGLPSVPLVAAGALGHPVHLAPVPRR